MKEAQAVLNLYKPGSPALNLLKKSGPRAELLRYIEALETVDAAWQALPFEAAAEAAEEGLHEIEVGKIGVDAGLCWLGDPAYFWPKEESDQEPAITRIGTWGDFVDQLHSTDHPSYHSFDILGAVTMTGIGDGVYPVYALVDEKGMVYQATVVFIPPSQDDDAEEPAEDDSVDPTQLKSFDEPGDEGFLSEDEKE